MSTKADAIHSELPINPSGDSGTAVVASPLVVGVGEEQYAAEQAAVAARRHNNEMHDVLSAANRVARDRTRGEARTVAVAERHAVQSDANDPTYQPVVAVPIADVDVSRTKKEPLTDEDADLVKPDGYKIGNYDTSEYKIEEYKSIYDGGKL